MKVVLDTNIFVDAFFGISENCSIVLRREHKGEFSIVMSDEMLEELINRLKQSMEELNLCMEDREVIYRMLSRALHRSIRVEPVTKFKKCKHSNDNKFISCAIDGNADYIISKDGHLHELKSQTIKNKANQPIKILYPDEFILELDKVKLITHFKR